MSRAALHEPPAGGEVFREQLRMTGLAVRKEVVWGGIIAAVLLVGLVILRRVLVARLTSEGLIPDVVSIDFQAARMHQMSVMALPCVVLGLVAPLGFWRTQEPARRGYVWTLPVDRVRHTLLKVAGGWVWLVGIVVAVLLWTLVAAGGGVSGGGLLWGEAALPRWMWIVPLSAATVAYLLGTIAVISTDHPWRWAVRVTLGGPALAAIAGGLTASGVAQAEVVFDALEALFYGRHGLLTLATGHAPSVALRARVPSPEAWAVASLVWMAPGLAGLYASARRYQER